MPEVELRINGNRLTGWTGVRIRKSIEQLADEFELQITNKRIDAAGRISNTGVSQGEVKIIADLVREDDKVEVFIDQELVITGYVFEYDFDYDDKRADLRISGLSKTGDLVDCSAVHKPGLWRDVSLTDICFELCKPFDIGVLLNGNAGEKFKRFKLEQGEKVFDAISRACVARGMLPMTDVYGDLIISRASRVHEGAVIELGSNVLAGGVNRTRHDNFSNYIFKGQTKASDEWSGKQASQLKGEVENPEVARYRPLVLIAQKMRKKEDLGRRAIWERNVRWGRSNRSRYMVPEWTFKDTQGRPRLWSTNQLATVNDDWSGVYGDKLVTSVEFLLSDSRVTTLELAEPETFEVLEGSASGFGS